MGSTRNTLVITVIALLLIAVPFILWKANHVGEPVYQGKRLTGWVEQWKTNRWSISKAAANRVAEKEAETAIRVIGTNGIPFLLDSRTRGNQSGARTPEKLFRAPGTHVCG